jgi:hypothetical protein
MHLPWMKFNEPKIFYMPESGAGSGGDGAGNGAGGAGVGDGAGDGDDNLPSWRDGLSEELQTVSALENIKDIDSLAKGYVELKAYQGNSIRLPGADASDDDWKQTEDRLRDKIPNLMRKPNFDDETQSEEFYKSLGRPEDAEAYKTPELDIPEGITPDKNMELLFRGASIKAGLSQKQFADIYANITKAQLGSAVQAHQDKAAAKTALSEEWGVAHDRNSASAKKIAQDTKAPKQLLDAIEAGDASPDTLRWLYNINKAMRGGGLEIAGQGGGEDIMSPGEANLKISEIMNNREHPYWNAGDAGHKAAVDRVVKLTGLANPTASTDPNQLRA